MAPEEVALLKGELVGINQKLWILGGLFTSEGSFFDVFLKLIDLPPGLDPKKVPGARSEAKKLDDFLGELVFGTRDRRSLFAEVGTRAAAALSAIQKASR